MRVPVHIYCIYLYYIVIRPVSQMLLTLAKIALKWFAWTDF